MQDRHPPGAAGAPLVQLLRRHLETFETGAEVCEIYSDVDGQVKIARRRIEEVLADDAGEDHE